jgi:hypothetical protein
MYMDSEKKKQMEKMEKMEKSSVSSQNSNPSVLGGKPRIYP